MDGFYIGRYETGNVLSNVPVVRRLNTVIGDINWYTAYARMRNISVNENIQTSMIWGCLWDETLQWMIDTGERTQVEVAVCSDNWGNYSKSNFKYYNGMEFVDKGLGKYEKVPTGSSEKNKSSNIYDMAGNIAEWTLESNGSKGSFYRMMRGGSGLFNLNYDTSRTQPVAYRYGVTPGSENYRYGHGCRAYFYIK